MGKKGIIDQGKKEKREDGNVGKWREEGKKLRSEKRIKGRWGKGKKAGKKGIREQGKI